MANVETKSPTDGRTIRDPEHLNDAIRLTSRSTWILLGGLSLCMLGVIIWGFLGRLDFHAKGPGVILLDESAVANVVARAGGTVTKIHVKTGQVVELGQVLVSVKLDEIEERRDQAAIALKAQQDEWTRYQATSASDVKRRQQDLDQEIRSLNASLAESDKSRTMLEKLYNDYVTQLQRGLATREQVQQAFDRLNSMRQSIREMTDRISTQKTQQIEFEDQVARSLAQMRMQVIDAESRLKDLQVQFDVGSQIRSPVNGTVSELTVQMNQTVASGMKLLVIESGSGQAPLIVHAYLPIDQGKRVEVGMPVQVSPSSIDERIYGSIRGQVAKVSALPMSREGLQAVLGDPALVAMMMIGGAPIEVLISLDRSPDTADGLAWTSLTSPPTAVTPGVTAASRIVVDRVRPISLILPIAETWTHL
ncbi:MAG: NHLP bacteriocin system secretion protein [Enhydrobacter sp.]|nr:MAG: NHLP bacteriocin system secretion protein [Enhydrobacter sp.]